MEESAHIVRDKDPKKSNPADSPGMSYRTLTLRRSGGPYPPDGVPPWFGMAAGTAGSSRACARLE
jgi:hypothetical protein